MLITLIGREEERIEESLPGLELTANFLSKINLELNSTPEDKEFKDTLHENGLYFVDPDKMRAMIDERLPSADGKTRLDMFHVLNLLVFHSDRLHTAKCENHEVDQRLKIKCAVSEDEVNDARQYLAEAEATFRSALDQFDISNQGLIVSS